MFLPVSSKSTRLPFMVIILCHSEKLLPLVITSFTAFFFFFLKGGVVVKFPKVEVSKNDLCTFPSCCGPIARHFHRHTPLTHTHTHTHTYTHTHTHTHTCTPTHTHTYTHTLHTNVGTYPLHVVSIIIGLFI